MIIRLKANNCFLSLFNKPDGILNLLQETTSVYGFFG
jgi:hypothetical protein